MESLKQKLREIEKDEIIHALKECNCVRARAARRLGITKRMIGYKIKKYGLMIKEVVSVEDSCAEQHGHKEQQCIIYFSNEKGEEDEKKFFGNRSYDSYDVHDSGGGMG